MISGFNLYLFLAGMIEQEVWKLEIKISSSNTWKRHTRHRTGLLGYTKSSHPKTGGEVSQRLALDYMNSRYESQCSICRTLHDHTVEGEPM